LPIETFGGISELNPSYPPTSDGLVGGDDHIRGIKAAVKASFPNITDPVTATSEALNAAAALVTDGVTKLADAGVKFKTNTKDGFENPSAGKVSVTAQDGSAVKQTVVEFSGADKSAKFNGPLKGGTGQLVPIGGTLIWWEDTLPPEGGYAWANGGKVNVADCPVMASRPFWQARFTDGGTKILLPDLQEVVPVGKSTMGGGTSPGLLASIASGVKTVVASIFGADTKTIDTANLPPYTPTGTIANGAITSTPKVGGSTSVKGGTNTLIVINNGSGVFVPYTSDNNANLTVESTQATSTFTGAAQGGMSAPIGLAQPSAVVNYIIRVG
jgi:microcystin-dependent protein